MTDFDIDHLAGRAISGTAHDSERQAALLVDGRGLIQACGGNCKSVLGYRRGELLFRHISTLVPQFAAVPLFVNGQLNALVGFLGHCDLPFVIRHRDGHTFSSRLSFMQPHHIGPSRIRVLIAPPLTGRHAASPRRHTGA